MEESLRLVRETIGNEVEEDSILRKLCLEDAEERDQIRNKLSYFSETQEKRSHPVLSSSALSISSLTNGNSPLNQKKQENKQDDENHLFNSKRIALSTCKDIERELQAVENRIAFYRQARQEQQEAVQDAHLFYQSKETASKTQQNPLLQDQYKQNQENPSNQNAGQVADEVENSLLKCELLLSKATASSCYRQKALSSTSSSSSSSSESSTSLKKGSSSVRIQPIHPTTTTTTTTTTAISTEEIALETKAQAMQSLLVTCQQEIEQEASDLYLQKKSIQSKQCQELRKKFASKKKMMLAALKETLETENKRLIDIQQVHLEKELTKEMTLYKEEMLQKRQDQMTQLLIEHSKKHESIFKQTELKIQQETQVQMDLVSRDCQFNFEKELNQLNQKYQITFQEWEIQIKKQFETKLQKQREEKTMDLLQAQEKKRCLFEKEIISIETKKQQEEMEKLQKALQIGLEMHLQKIRTQMETIHLNQKETIKKQAQHALEIETTELETMLQNQFLQEKQNLEIQFNHEKHCQLEKIITKYQNLETKQRLEMQTHFSTQLEILLQKEKWNLQQKKQQNLQILQKQQEKEIRQKIAFFLFEQEQILLKELSIKKKEFTNWYLETLDTKQHCFLQAICQLQNEAKNFLSTSSNVTKWTNKNSIKDINDNVEKKDTILQSLCCCNNCGKEFLPTKFLKNLDLLVEKMNELEEEQIILIEKITHATQMYVQTKQKMIQLEEENIFFKEKTLEMEQIIQDKNQICMKLYQANEVLLQKILQQQQTNQQEEKQHKEQEEKQHKEQEEVFDLVDLENINEAKATDTK